MQTVRLIMNDIGVTEEDKQCVRNFLNTTEEEIKRDVDILKEWIRKEPHLPQDLPDDYIFESLLIRNKCRVEKTKKRIDAYFTMKNIWPEIFANINQVIPSKLPLTVLPMKPLNKNRERIFIVHIFDLNECNFDQLIDISISIQEIFLKLDYNTGIRLVLNCENVDLWSVIKLCSLNKVLITQKASLSVFSNSLKGFHYYKLPKISENLVDLFRTVLPKKALDRVTFHSDVDSLSEYIPKELLPSDLGGEQKSIRELTDEWDELYRNYHYLLTRARELKSNEKIRIGKHQFDPSDMYGADGTFKQLNID